MLEQDVELARLLVSKLDEISQQAKQMHERLRSTKAELDEAVKVREARSAYLDTLSRAAELLQRSDLHVDSPVTSDLEDQVTEMGKQLEEINKEASKYRNLIDELNQSAPHLIKEATGRNPEDIAASSETETITEDVVEEVEDSDTAGDAIEEDEAEEAEETGSDFESEETEASENGMHAEVDAQAAAEDEDTAGEEPVEEANDERDKGLRRFNVNNLKTKEVFTFGRGAKYIVDVASVLTRVPHYDHNLRGIEEKQVKDELVRDFDSLTKELSGDICLVFDAWHKTDVNHGNNLSLEFPTGGEEGDKTAANDRIISLLDKHIAEGKTVCVVTGDSTLIKGINADGAFSLALGEFFVT